MGVSVVSVASIVGGAKPFKRQADAQRVWLAHTICHVNELQCLGIKVHQTERAEDVLMGYDKSKCLEFGVAGKSCTLQ